MEARREAAESVEAVVIGGGVVGCAILLELASRGIEALLLEAEPDVGEGTSKANSAILHTGFDAKPGTTEARLLRRSAEHWPVLLEALRVPFLACGALMLARTAEEAVRLEDVARLAASHGVDAELVDRPWLREAAPYLTDDAVRALHIPSEGIVDPFWLTRAYAEAAVGLGARVRTRSAVTALDVTPDGVAIVIGGDGGSVLARHAFVAAGIRSDEVARLAGDDSFSLTPRKGEFLVSERTAGVDRIVLPIPGPLGKGMLVTPIVFGGVLLGPTADDGEDKTDRSTTAEARTRILAACRGLVPAVDEMVPIRSFAGVRAVSSTGDYIIRPSTAGDRVTIVAGIRSTGISASPGIAEAAVALAFAARGWPDLPRRNPVVTGAELDAAAIEIVCVCRSIGDAEVDAALAGPTTVTTTDALKRRCGIGFGDCQGNQCLVEAIDRIATGAGISPGDVEKGPVGSWLVVAGRSATDAPDERQPAPGDEASERPADVLVVGAGLAGIGAALALIDAGLAVTVADRASQAGGALAGISRDRWTTDEQDAVAALAQAIDDHRLRWLPETTVVGLSWTGGAWEAELLGPSESGPMDARGILLATGGYVMPREHRAIHGPRPSGVMTADFAISASGRGWLPGRRLVVVGEGRLAAGTAERLRGAGAAVMELPAGRRDGDAIESVVAVRGQPRLTGVLADGHWLDADGLVLADRLQPATFLLRGLGIGDERPGIPAPVDASGALPVERAWAAGTCVTADVDHRGSLAAGRRVAPAIITAMGSESASVTGATRR